MSHYQREGSLMWRPHVHEVDHQAVKLGTELWKAVQFRLGSSPVTAGAPVLAQLLDIGERTSLRPVTDGFPLRPAAARQASAEVLEDALLDRDLEGNDVSGHLSQPWQSVSNHTAAASHHRTRRLNAWSATWSGARSAAKGPAPESITSFATGRRQRSQLRRSRT